MSTAGTDVRRGPEQGGDREAFMERLRAFVGRPARPPWEAPDPVNEAMIRQFCEVMGDASPVYNDPSIAASSVHGGIVAPPVMQDVWVMRGFIEPADPAGRDQGQAGLLALLAEEGFTAIVATNADQEFLRYLRPGDWLTAHRTIEAVSEEKETALGPGHFFTVKTSYVDQNDEEVGVQHFRMLVYRP
ncbi:MAG TPA: MaoC family dehydratase N-terminal domain-containing protein, partial [Actinomycetota bacterium]